MIGCARLSRLNGFWRLHDSWRISMVTSTCLDAMPLTISQAEKNPNYSTCAFHFRLLSRLSIHGPCTHINWSHVCTLWSFYAVRSIWVNHSIPLCQNSIWGPTENSRYNNHHGSPRWNPVGFPNSLCVNSLEPFTDSHRLKAWRFRRRFFRRVKTCCFPKQQN